MPSLKELRERYGITGEGSDIPSNEGGGKISIYVEPGNAPVELITELYIQLSSLYRAYGGSGLEFRHEEPRSLVAKEIMQ